MNVSVVIATHGDDRWRDLALARAAPSAEGQGAVEVLVEHVADTVTLAEVRNNAVAGAAGDWICLIDADDELEPGYLHAAAAALQMTPWRPPESRMALLAPAVRYVRDGTPDATPFIPNAGRWPAMNECVIGSVIPRELFLRVGGFRDRTDDGTPITIYEDWDLFLRMFAAGASIVHVPDAVYRAHMSAGSRNHGPDSLRVYRAIWDDHVLRTAW